jgi:hypothetical protein
LGLDWLRSSADTAWHPDLTTNEACRKTDRQTKIPSVIHMPLSALLHMTSQIEEAVKKQCRLIPTQMQHSLTKPKYKKITQAET